MLRLDTLWTEFWTGLDFANYLPVFSFLFLSSIGFKIPIVTRFVIFSSSLFNRTRQSGQMDLVWYIWTTAKFLVNHSNFEIAHSFM